MPALNEEQNLSNAIENVLDSLKKLNINGEIIVVNDGSSDATESIAKDFSQKYDFIKVVSHSSPQGIGRSFWDGFLQSSSEFVTFVPGDGENNAYEILRYLKLAEDVDVVIPFVFNLEARSFYRQIVSKLYNKIIKYTFGISLHYTNGTVIYRTSVLRQFDLKCNGFFYQTELLIKTIRAGYLFAEIPYALRVREKGKSKAITFKALKKVIQDYLATFKSIYFKKVDIKKEWTSDSATQKRWRQVEQT
jgi:glycosyltransferase involved in cell wall biosynthesis